MSMFNAVEMAPRDPILGLNEQFAADTNPNKVNLGVGVYYDDNGKLPLLECVKAAEADMLKAPTARGYLPIDGIAAYDSAVKNLVFGADIIAGFPTESEDMFRRSLALVDECGLTHLHVFPYSARPGTPAGRMPQLPRDLVKQRARRLREKGAAALRLHLDAQVGGRRCALIESRDLGRTEHFTRIRIGPAIEIGRIVDVEVAGHDGRQLVAA